VWTAEGWLHVAVVIDLFSRRVVGWSMSAEMTEQFVTHALPSQYTSEQLQKLMTDHSIICSMSRSGNVWDNAAMENFFSSLKTERTARKTYRARTKPRLMCSITSNALTNAKRRHSTIGYRSPSSSRCRRA
jgi:putative transposase